MTDMAPTLEQWRRLYEVAARVKQLAPWQWMLETDLFAIQHPHTGELGYLSVMGNLGEHLAIANYPGATGYHGFWRMATGSEQDVQDEYFLLPQLQASFEDRESIEKPDRAVMQALGLKYRGKQAWPMFRSFRPGYMPWYLEAPEADTLYWTLEQLLVVAPRFQGNARPARARIPTEYPARVSAVEDGAITWHDAVVRAPDYDPPQISIELPAGLIETVRRLKRGLREVQVDLSPQPYFIGERGERPLVACILMAVDVESAFVICVEALAAEHGVEAMYGQAPGRLLEALVQLGARPATLAVREWRLESVLAPIAGAIGVQLVRKKRLSVLARVSREFERRMSR